MRKLCPNLYILSFEAKETPNNRGSDDFERRFYSSTPDTSMLISSTTSQQQKSEPKQTTTTSNPQQQYRDLLRELEKHEDYREEIEEDEGEVVELSIDLPEDDDDDDDDKNSPKTSQNKINEDSDYE